MNRIVLLLSLFTLLSCRDNVSQSVISIGADGWSETTVHSFRYRNIDTMNYRDLMLHLAINSKMNFSELKVVLTITAPDSSFYRDTMIVKIDKSNYIKLSDSFSIDQMLIENMLLKEGWYKFDVKQLSSHRIKYIDKLGVLVAPQR